MMVRAIPHNSKCRYGVPIRRARCGRCQAKSADNTLCIIEHFGNADAVPQPPERCLSRKAGIMRCCLSFLRILGILFGGFGAACASYSRGYLKSRKFRTFLQTRLDSTLKNIPRLCRGIFFLLFCDENRASSNRFYPVGKSRCIFAAMPCFLLVLQYRYGILLNRESLWDF